MPRVRKGGESDDRTEDDEIRDALGDWLKQKPNALRSPNPREPQRNRSPAPKGNVHHHRRRWNRLHVGDRE